MKLIDYMRAKGLNDRQMAEAAGISRVVVTKTRLGRTTPSPATMRAFKLATKGTVTADDFIMERE